LSTVHQIGTAAAREKAWGSLLPRNYFSCVSPAEMNTPFHILVVDDYALWRKFVISALREHIESCIFCEAADGSEAVQFAVDIQPNLITLDIGLPKLNGLEAARQIREKCPDTKILFVSANRALDLAEAAFAAGGDGYVVKSDGKAELLRAVDTVKHSCRFISQTLAQGQLSALA
jgi:DNA-binding NarL/FixJ family response regulator